MSSPNDGDYVGSVSETKRAHIIARDSKATHLLRARAVVYYVTRGLRSSFDRLAYASRDRLTFTLLLLSYAGTYVTFAGLFGSAHVVPVAKWVFAAASVVGSAAAYLRKYVERIRWEVDSNNPGYARFVATMTKEAQSSRSMILVADDRNQNHGILYSNVIPEYLRNTIRVDPHSFQIPDLIEKHADLLIVKEKSVLVNEGKVRLATDIDELTADASVPVVLQRTCYFHDRVTNNLAKKRITSGDGMFFGHVFMQDGERLVRLRHAAKLSNQLGGSTLLITSDKKLVYVEQGSGAAENPSKYASAGSGSFDWRRLDRRRKKEPNLRFTDFVRSEIERELIEEIGVNPAVQHRTFLAGYGRSLYRNGKPDIYALTVTEQTFHELRVRYQEWTFIRDTLQFTDIPALNAEAVRLILLRMFQSFKKRSRGNPEASVPLIINILAVVSFIDHEFGFGRDPVAQFYR